MSGLVPGYPAFKAFKGSEDQSVGSTLAAPAVAVHGVAGTTEWDYSIVAVGPGGDGPESPVGKVTTGNAALTGANYNQVTWTAGAIATGGYKILRRQGAAGEMLLYATVAAGVLTYQDTGAGVPVAYVANILESVSPNQSFSYIGPNGVLTFYKGQIERVPVPIAADLIAKGLAVQA